MMISAARKMMFFAAQKVAGGLRPHPLLGIWRRQIPLFTILGRCRKQS
jgi:hypothetical protein